MKPHFRYVLIIPKFNIAHIEENLQSCTQTHIISWKRKIMLFYNDKFFKGMEVRLQGASLISGIWRLCTAHLYARPSLLFWQQNSKEYRALHHIKICQNKRSYVKLEQKQLRNNCRNILKSYIESITRCNRNFDALTVED